MRNALKMTHSRANSLVNLNVLLNNTYQLIITINVIRFSDSNSVLKDCTVGRTSRERDTNQLLYNYRHNSTSLRILLASVPPNDIRYDCAHHYDAVEHCVRIAIGVQ